MIQYKIRLDYYPKKHWGLLEQQVRKLSANDRAAGISPTTWHVVQENLHTSVRETAKREAMKILRLKHPVGGFSLLVEEP